VSSRHWLLRVPESLAADGSWCWKNAADESATVQGDLAAFVAVYLSAPRQSVILLLPAAHLLAVPVAVPVRQQRQLLSALPFLLEETLATDIERFHVVAGARIDGQRMQAVAIERAALQSVLSLLQNVGIDPDIISGDALALPAPGTLFLDGARSLLRAHDESTLGFDAQDAAAVVAALTWPPASSLHVLCGPAGGESVARTVETEISTRDDAPAVQVDETARELLDVLATRSAEAWSRVPNLRQGVFARSGSGEFSLGFDWRPLAWLAACWAVVALGYHVALGVSYTRSADAIQLAQVELYKQVFPGSSNVPYPRKQMEGQLNGAGSRDGLFVSLVARTAEAFSESGGTGAGYRPGNLAWDGAQKQLRMDVLARSLEDLDKLRGALEQKGLMVDIGAGIAQDGGYKARMNVGEGA
jgi:general secretion pathway protein L